MKKLWHYRFFLLLICGGIFYAGWSFSRGGPESMPALSMVSLAENEKESGELPAAEAPEPLLAAEEEERPPEEETSGEEMREEPERVLTMQKADASYMDDALFIGDSRTVGIYNYGNFDRSGFFCSSGLSVYKLFQTPKKKARDGNWTTDLETFLKQRQYRKIYIMLGINELGVADQDYFIAHYREALERIKALQPDAVIYLEGIMQITRQRSQKGDYITNEQIAERNAAIAGLADGKEILYLDVNNVLCGEDGALNPEYTSDGVHLYAKDVHIWTDYLLENAAVWAEPEKEAGE